MITTCCIDVGLRNLSLCIMNSNYEILLWNIYDVFETCEKTCTAKMKNDKICNKKCSYKYNNTDNIESYSCKLHFPKNIKITNKNKITLKTIDKYLLQEIALKFISKIEEIYNTNIDIFKSLNSIYIELQPKCNPKMLFISHILYGKLIDVFKISREDSKAGRVKALDELSKRITDLHNSNSVNAEIIKKMLEELEVKNLKVLNLSLALQKQDSLNIHLVKRTRKNISDKKLKKSLEKLGFVFY